VLQIPKTYLLSVTFLLSFTFPAWPETYPDKRPQVVVSVFNDADVGATVLAQAEREGTEIFHRAGVEVVWANCKTREVRSSDTGGCERFDWPTHLSVRILPGSLLSTNEVFGVAFLSVVGTGCYSDVFYDRAVALHADSKVGLADILGNVMVHELGHLLLGSNAHAPWGIMRAHWQGEELRRMAKGNLLFTADQAGHMRGKLIAGRPSLVVAARSSY
jgi:hypothetical protein